MTWRPAATGFWRGASDVAGAVRDILASARFRRALAATVRQRVADNRWPILISLGLATLIYNGIHKRPTEEFVRNVAVKVRDAPEGVRIGIEPPTVRVVFRGSREDMLGLDMAPPVVYVAYPGGQETDAGGGIPVKLRRKRDVRLAGMRGFGSVSVVSVEPDEVTLVKDEEATIGFDIEAPRLEGTPHRGFRAEVVDYSPRRAAVTGGSRRLKGWDALGYKLQLAPVSVEGRAADFSREVEVLPPAGEDAMGLTLPASKVKVDVRIVQPRHSQTLDGIPVRLSFPQGYAFPCGVAVEPGSVRVTLVGAEEQLRNMTAGDIGVYAEIPEGAALAAETPLEVALVARAPQDRSIFEINLSPPQVAVTAIEAAPDVPEEPGEPGLTDAPPAAGAPGEADAPGAPAVTDESGASAPAEDAE